MKKINIKKILKDNKVTISNFSNTLNISRPTLYDYISKFENGEQILNDRIQIIFQQLFGVENSYDEFHNKLTNLTVKTSFMVKSMEIEFNNIDNGITTNATICGVNDAIKINQNGNTINLDYIELQQIFITMQNMQKNHKSNQQTTTNNSNIERSIKLSEKEDNSKIEPLIEPMVENNPEVFIPVIHTESEFKEVIKSNFKTLNPLTSNDKVIVDKIREEFYEEPFEESYEEPLEDLEEVFMTNYDDIIIDKVDFKSNDYRNKFKDYIKPDRPTYSVDPLGKFQSKYEMRLFKNKREALDYFNLIKKDLDKEPSLSFDKDSILDTNNAINSIYITRL